MVKIFVSDKCGVCKNLIDIIEKENLSCDIEIVNIDKNPDIINKYNIIAVPMFVDDDGKIISGEQVAKKCILH